MKNQFNIKPAETLKKIKSSVAKQESNNILKFASFLQCCEMGPDVNGGGRDSNYAMSVFSL